MRIEISESEERVGVACKIETIGSVDIYENYTGIGMITPIGEFGICERDDGIWILKDGVEVYRYDMNGPAIVEGSDDRS